MLTWFNNFARWVFNKQLSSIQVCDCHLEAAQSLNKSDTLDHVKVISITPKFLLR